MEGIWVGWCKKSSHIKNQREEQAEPESCGECNKFINHARRFPAEERLAGRATSTTTTSMHNEQRVEQSNEVATETILPGSQQQPQTGKDDDVAVEVPGNDGHRCQIEQETDKNDQLELATFVTLEEAVHYLMKELRSNRA